MKKTIFTLALLAATSLLADATIRVCYNDSPTPGQFTTLDAAVAASIAGDTIYVQPSSFVYSSCNNISKRLTIIGGGLAPEKTPSLLTMVNCMNFINGSAGSKIVGLYFTNNAPINLYDGVSNMVFQRCFFTATSNIAISFVSTSTFLNESFNECIFDAANNANVFNNNGATVNNLQCNNCVFRLSGVSGTYMITNGFCSGWNFNNCLFYGYNNGSSNISPMVSSGAFTLNFNSCLFNKVYMNMSGSTFTNCLTFGCTNNNIWDISGNTNSNTSGSNISNQDPQFTNSCWQTACSYSFSRNAYSVQATSPTLIANHSGSLYDIGPYGGTGLYSYNNTHDAPLPVIQSLVVGNSNIQSGQNLQIDVVSKKRN